MVLLFSIRSQVYQDSGVDISLIVLSEQDYTAADEIHAVFWSCKGQQRGQGCFQENTGTDGKVANHTI